MTTRLLCCITQFYRQFITWTAALVLFVILLRIFEHILVAQHSSESLSFLVLLLGLLNDLLFTCSYLFFISVLTAMFWLWKPQAAKIIFVIISSIFLIFSAAVIRYYVSTNTLLGADLWGYSFSDIKGTVTSSTTFTLSDVVLISLLAAFIPTILFLQRTKRMAPQYLTPFLLFGFLVSSFLVNKATAKAPFTSLSLSKGGHFIASNMKAQKTSKATVQFHEFPLLRSDNTPDALSPFFNLGESKPNIVMLIVEGLGRDFTGPSASFKGFTPFLDSLSNESLYWSNFLSTSGRSFAGLPSILGSLPYGFNGFSELGTNMPAHQSLVSILKQNGYHTSYFYGGNVNFDKQDVFLERQGIDFILDENKFGDGYKNPDKKSWGFADGDLYKRSLEVLNPTRQPLLNIYFTLTTHEPFTVPDEEKWEELVAQKISQMTEAEQKRFAPYKHVWKALLYSDASISEFMAAYAKRADYNNTIFIITGDHRLIPVTEQDQLRRFHVPLLIHSPMLKRSKFFPALSSHLDITPSLIQLFRHYKNFNLPAEVHWMGKGLDTAESFNTSYELPLMRNKNLLDDYIFGNYFLSGNELYYIKNNLQLQPLRSPQPLALLQHKLDSFRQLNQFVCSRKSLMLMSGNAHVNENAVLFTPDEEKKFIMLSSGSKEPDTLFFKARNFAARGNYEATRLLCKKVLNESPNYHDVRVLLGRTYLWEKKYSTAVSIFSEVVRRNPAYEDAYLAWADSEIWSGKKDSALIVINNGLKMLPQSKELKTKQLKARNISLN